MNEHTEPKEDIVRGKDPLRESLREHRHRIDVATTPDPDDGPVLTDVKAMLREGLAVIDGALEGEHPKEDCNG